MKKFNWNDAPEGTTDRCTETEVWIRIAGDTISFWNIGTEKWEATSLPLRPQWLMKKPEPEQKRVNLHSPTATEAEQMRVQHHAKSDAKMTVPGSAAIKTLEMLNYSFCGGLLWKPPLTKPTEMMLTRPIQFTGGRGGTQFTFPIRTLVNVVGKTTIPNTIVLHHQPTLRYAVVDKSAVEPVVSEEDELVKEARDLVGEYCDDVTVEALIKAGYRKQPETSQRFKKVETIRKNPNTKDSVCEPGLWVACIEDTHSAHMQVIGCNGSDKAKAEELRDYVLARLQ